MLPSELQLGDIICFQTKFGVPDHVAMYTGMIGDKHYVTHSVISAKSGLQSTALKNLVRMDVFRPANKELGERAAKRLLQWSKYKIPYDNRRMQLIVKLSDNLREIARIRNVEEPIDFLLKEMIRVAHLKFYERIKYAARRDTCPVKILEGVETRGWHCVQAVILAYQVEELVPYVKTLEMIQNEMAHQALTIEQITESWISDKHCPEEIIETYDLPSSYVEYANGLRSKEDEFPDFFISDKRDVTFTHHNYHPCLVAWDYEKEPSIDAFIDKFDSCLDLPAKFCFTDSLFAFMQNNPRHWSYLGQLNRETLPANFNEAEKALHYSRTSELERETMLLQEEIKRARALSSPSLSRHGSSLGLVFSPTSIASESSADGAKTPNKMLRRISSGLDVFTTGWDAFRALESPGEETTTVPSPLIERKFLKKKVE